MAANEILKFVETDTTTNLLTQAEYAADPQRGIGNQPGIARSKLVNKAMRQASLVAAAIAQYAADRQLLDVTDDLTPAALASIIADALGADFASKTGVQKASYSVSSATGTADALIGEYTPDITALTNGMSLFLRAAAANATTTPTFTPNTGTIAAKTIVKGNDIPLVAGDIAGAGHWLEFQYDLTLDKWIIQNPAKGVNVNTVVDASETAKGIAELATSAEAVAGTDDARIITPLKLRNGLNAAGSAPIYACRAWVNFNGTGTVAIRASGNVSSITDNGTGDYTINFTTAIADANYSAVLSATTVVQTNTQANASPNIHTQLAASLRVSLPNTSGDTATYCAAIFR